MTDNKKQTASAKPARQPENLLDDFGVKPKAQPTVPDEADVKKDKAASPDPVAPTTDSRSAAHGRSQAAKKAGETGVGSQTAKKTSASKNATVVKNTSEKSADSKEAEKKKHVSDPVVATTASPVSRKESKAKDPAKKNAEVPAVPRSAKPAHRVMPYVLLLLAVFIGVSLLLNLLCNRDNSLATNPSAHWMGLVGYYICYGLFSTFGPAVFVLPLLLLNLAFFWKQYIDRRVTVSKIAASLLFLCVLSTVIHVFCMMYDPNIRFNMTAADLIKYGSRMTGGGLIGGKLGYYAYTYFSFIGSVILGFSLLALSLFYFLGMAPQNVWDALQVRRLARAERQKSVSEEDAEEARNKAEMDEKIRRVTGKQQSAKTVNSSSDGAVEVIEPAPAKTPEDKLAPMPLPRIDPNDGSRPFVPREVGKKLNEANATASVPVSPNSASQNPTPQKPVNNLTPPVTPSEKSAATAAPSATVQRPAVSASPVKNQDVAVDPIFPKTNEAKLVRKIPKEDRDFDLKNVFVDLDDKEEHRPKHVPVPPEVPLTGSRRTAGQAVPSAAASAVRPSVKKPLQEGASVRPSVRVGASANSAAAGKPVVPQSGEKNKPVFRQADRSVKKEYGLSSEEFEQLEAKQNPISKPSASAKKPTVPVVEKKVHSKPEPQKKYVFPPVSYLHPGEPMTEENRAEIQASMDQLAATLASFHVRVQEINYSCGPTVTRYEVILAAGVRVRTITGLSDDIALALRSSGGVRIEAPIPGTNAVGIEVPNKTRSIIYLRDLIESKAFSESKNKLTACLGADIAGQPLIFDIAKMPHLLIAGTTGSGKSVCINCIIMSLLYKARPDEVKLILIDPKKVEFSIYKNIPHLMAPVVTQPKDAAGALQAAVEEMERRFEVFESVGVRDLKGYNEITANDPDMPFIPQIVIIIDELADLMMTAKNEVETAICRIAQKARAAGMHLIIGTQRPSADVVTGLIKANVPSCIAFAVKSQVDSRVILDHGGAEALTGRGDMLFVPIGSMRDTRVQGAFVDDKEVEKICEFIRATNGTAQYDERFISKLKELAAQCGNKGRGSDDAVPVGNDGEKGDDPKYADAVRVAIEENRISTSLLQRKLEVGYSRAAKLIDRMQAEGIVSAPDGSKPRNILISKEQYLERFFDRPDGEQ